MEAQPLLTSPARIDVRLRADQKSRIQRAAAIRGLKVTDFLLQLALAEATRTIEEHDTWVLHRPDAEVFFAALLAPAKPGERLKHAARRYREQHLQHG